MADRRILLPLLLALAAVPYFLNLGATSIIDANEAFYAETPREMIASGNYISPTFNDEPRLNKPPLSYWVVAAFYRVAGVSLGASRLPIALGAMVIFATAFLLGRQAFSARAGWIAAITLAATPRMLLFSRRIIIDVYTAMFLGLTLLCFMMAESEPGKRRRWLLAMYVSVGLGILVKGPVAVAVPALVFLAYLLATRQLRSLGRMMLPTGALIVSAIVLPYYAALYAQEGWDAIASFLFRENLARYAEGVGAPDRGPFFYLPVVFADLYFPWSLLLPAALALVPWKRAARGEAGGPAAIGGGDAAPRARLLLGLWIVVIVVFFSLSKGQQDLYVLPFVVAGAALVGGVLDQWLTGASRRATRPRGHRQRRAAGGRLTRRRRSGGLARRLARRPAGDRRRAAGGGRHRRRRRRGHRGALAARATRVGSRARRRSHRGALDSRDLGAAGFRALQARAPPGEGDRTATRQAPGCRDLQDCRAEPRVLPAAARRPDGRRSAAQGLRVRVSGRRLGDAGRRLRGRQRRLPVPTRVIASAPRFDARLSDFLGRTPPRQLVLVSAAR